MMISIYEETNQIVSINSVSEESQQHIFPKVTQRTHKTSVLNSFKLSSGIGLDFSPCYSFFNSEQLFPVIQRNLQ